jgi:ATP-dependent protease ClpP protease subunit
MAKIFNLQCNKPIEIRNKSKDKAEILIYGAIGASFWEDSITAKQFSDELKKMDASIKEVDLRINSPGGDVFEGYAIANRIKQHSAKFTIYIDGLAASIASIIAIAGDEVVIGEGAQMMIHSAWTVAMGNARDLEKVIDRLGEIDEQLISLYVKKTGKSRAEIRDMVEKETWLNADEAVEMGFADRKFEESQPIAASVLDKATWINRVPKNLKTRDQQVKNKIEEFLKARK